MKPAPALAIVLAAALLAGCDGKPFRRMMLVGGWAPPGQSCDSRDGVVYDRDGSWAGYDVAGRWTLDGKRLRTQVTERGGFDQPAHKVSGERPSFATILTLSQTELTLQLKDGSTQTLQRCRR
jgi:hypothetical protein